MTYTLVQFEEESTSKGGHNLMVLVIGLMIMLWAARVGYAILYALDLKQRLQEQAPCVHLDQLGVYADDFQLLIRNHFNQILRIRRTVAPDALSRQNLLIHLLAETVRMTSKPAVADGEPHVTLSFTVESVDRSRVSCALYWGLTSSAYEEMLFQPRPARTSQVSVDSSNYVEANLLYLTPDDETEGHFYTASAEVTQTLETVAWSADVAGISFAIALHSQSAVDGVVVEISFCKVSSLDTQDEKCVIEVTQQVFLRKDHDGFHEIQGIYGFEDESELDCMICYDNPKNVMLLPCRHCSVCSVCLRSLRDEKCPLCRSPFASHVAFPPRKVKDEKVRRPVTPRNAAEYTRAAQGPSPPAREAPPFLHQISARAVRAQPRQARARATPESDQAEPLLATQDDHPLP